MNAVPESLRDDDLLPPDKNNLLIINDATASNSVEVQNMFTQYVHQRNLGCMCLVQNWFRQGKSSRTISLNTSYLILFNNPTDKYQISILGRRMFPRSTNYYLEAFNDVTSTSYRYLLIDYKSRMPDYLRPGTNLLSDRQVVKEVKKDVVFTDVEKLCTAGGVV